MATRKIPRRDYCVDLFTDVVIGANRNNVSKEVIFSEEYTPDALMSLINKSGVSCQLDDGNDQCVVELQCGSFTKIPFEFNFSSPLQITISTSESDTSIQYVSLYLVYVNAIAVNMRQIKTTNWPEQGKNIAINFSMALNRAAGEEKIKGKEVEILAPDKRIIHVKKSTSNFIWRGDTLVMNLKVGEGKYKMRIRYKTAQGWVPWSKWRRITPKRKMSL